MRGAITTQKQALIQITALCLIFNFESFCAMTTVPKKSAQIIAKRPLIMGDLFIQPNKEIIPIRNEIHIKRLKEMYNYPPEIELAEGDCLIKVWATSRDIENEPTKNEPQTAKKGVPSEKGRGALKQGKENWRVHEELAYRWGKSDNWCANKHPQLKHAFPSYLPLSLLQDQTEKSQLHLTIHGTAVRLLCKQDGYRYGSHKYELNFEQILTYVMNRPRYVTFRHNTQTVIADTYHRLTMQKAEAKEKGKENKKIETDEEEECAV